jgi:hypothetical protein
LPIKAALNQTFELLKNPQPATVSEEQNSDNHVWQDGTSVPHSNAYLVGTDQRQATGVWYAVDRELLFGVGRSGRYPSHPFSYIGRVCSRCYRKCGSYFLSHKFSYNSTRRAVDFTATVRLKDRVPLQWAQSSSASRFTAGALDYERERAVQVTFMQHVFT